MTETNIDDVIKDTFTGEMRNTLLNFVAYLRENNFLFKRGMGYWENQHYWMVTYQSEYVLYILLNGTGDEAKFSPVTIWSDDSDSKCFENYPLDKHQQEIAWKHVDFCENCGSCSGGTCKTVFEKEFSNVCRTTMRFINPDIQTLEFVKKIIAIRKNDIESPPAY